MNTPRIQHFKDKKIRVSKKLVGWTKFFSMKMKEKLFHKKRINSNLKLQLFRSKKKILCTKISHKNTK